MMRPQIQNDLASYRRHLSRMKREQEEGLLPQLPVADTDANRISMFIAEVRHGCWCWLFNVAYQYVSSL